MREMNKHDSEILTENITELYKVLDDVDAEKDKERIKTRYITCVETLYELAKKYNDFEQYINSINATRTRKPDVNMAMRKISMYVK